MLGWGQAFLRIPKFQVFQDLLDDAGIFNKTNNAKAVPVALHRNSDAGLGGRIAGGLLEQLLDRLPGGFTEQAQIFRVVSDRIFLVSRWAVLKTALDDRCLTVSPINSCSF